VLLVAKVLKNIMKEDKKVLTGILMGIAGMIAAKNMSKTGSSSSIHPGFEDAKKAFEELKRTTDPSPNHAWRLRTWNFSIEKIEQFFKRLEDQEVRGIEWEQALDYSIEAVPRLENNHQPKPGISRMERRMIGTNFYIIEDFLKELKEEENQALARFTESWNDFWAEDEWSPQSRHTVPQSLSVQSRHNVPQSLSAQSRHNVPQQAVYGMGPRRSSSTESQAPDIWELGREEFINQAGLRWLDNSLTSDKLYIITSSPINNVRDMNKVVVTGQDRLFDQKPIFQSQRFPGKKSAPIWFAYGSEWFDWMLNNMPEWSLSARYLYEITLNMDKVLNLDNDEQLRLFKRHSKQAMGFNFGGGRAVDWKWVTDNYSGITSKNNFHHLFATWDIPSGCVWKWDAIDSMHLVSFSPNAEDQNPRATPIYAGSFSKE
jgi:hypothetical protein